MADRHPGRGRSARFRPAHVAGLFVFYGVLAFCVLAFALYYVFTVGELRLAIVLAVAFAAVATVVHVKRGRRDRVDSLIDHGP
jgi:hypothetical protein